MQDTRCMMGRAEVCGVARMSRYLWNVTALGPSGQPITTQQQQQHKCKQKMTNCEGLTSKKALSVHPSDQKVIPAVNQRSLEVPTGVLAAVAVLWCCIWTPGCPQCDWATLGGWLLCGQWRYSLSVSISPQNFIPHSLFLCFCYSSFYPPFIREQDWPAAFRPATRKSTSSGKVLTQLERIRQANNWPDFKNGMKSLRLFTRTLLFCRQKSESWTSDQSTWCWHADDVT